jgi:chitin synthase
MQRTGFAFPIFLVVPVSVVFLTDACSARMADSCFMANVLSKELFWQCQPRLISFWSWNFWLSPQTWIWLGWLLSQFWISIHLWAPKHERLARSEKFVILSLSLILYMIVCLDYLLTLSTIVSLSIKHWLLIVDVMIKLKYGRK